MFNFYPYEENRKKFYNKICTEFPFIKKETIGKSLVGRDIEAFTVGCSECKVLMAGAFHGSEWLTINIILHFMWDLCRSYSNGNAILGIRLKRFLHRRGITFVPCVNPDGVEINLKGFTSAEKYAGMVSAITPATCRWQANARGVDINHNFPADWEKIHTLEQESGIVSPSSTRYGGKSPASEPETTALMNLCIRENFSRAYAMHSQGREIYYTYKDKTPKASPTMARLFAGTSGYRLSEPPEIASGAGFKEWFIEKFGKPAFTFEIGKGENPLPLTDSDSEYNILLKTLCLTAIV